MTWSHYFSIKWVKAEGKHDSENIISDAITQMQRSMLKSFVCVFIVPKYTASGLATPGPLSWLRPLRLRFYC